MLDCSVSVAEIDALLDISDEGPDPARVAEARSEIEGFKRALAALPARPRFLDLGAGTGSVALEYLRLRRASPA